jgi:hypothetical protein
MAQVSPSDDMLTSINFRAVQLPPPPPRPRNTDLDDTPPHSHSGHLPGLPQPSCIPFVACEICAITAVLEYSTMI